MIFSASWSSEQSAASPTGVEVVTGAADPLPLALIVVGTGIGVGVGVVGGILVGVGVAVGAGVGVAVGGKGVAVGTGLGVDVAVGTDGVGMDVGSGVHVGTSVGSGIGALSLPPPQAASTNISTGSSNSSDMDVSLISNPTPIVPNPPWDS